MLPNEVGTSGWLVEELAAARIVERERLEPYLAEFNADSPYADADAFSKYLAREGILSKYQAKRAVDGDAKKLILGAYLLVDVIGNGSLGPVYKSMGRADQKLYAVKVLPRRAWNVRLARSQVHAFEELRSLDGMVPFVDVGTAHGLHYLVWPFAEGRSLESIVRECGPLSPGEIARIGVRTAEALKVALSRGLIHGLIKPSNILVADDGQSRILDFGIGALLAENAEEDLLVDTVSRAGSLAQMLECSAPESVADSSQWTPLADQYSLGCTLYFSATGRYPFAGGTFVDKMFSHQSKKAASVRSLNRDVPQGLADVIDRLMQKNPSDRYPKLDELIGELAPLATASRVRSPVPINVETPPPMSRLTTVPPSELRIMEPPILEWSAEEVKRGFLGRMFGASDKGDDSLHATVVASGPAHAGDTIVLHVYMHGAADSEPLAAAVREQRETAFILGTGRSRRDVREGSHVGLHLSAGGASITDPLQEYDRTLEATLFRFPITIPDTAKRQPIKSRLMIGQEGKLIFQVDFVIPVG